MEDEIGTYHHVSEAGRLPDVTQIEAEARIRVHASHVILLLLVAAEDANLPETGVEKSREHGVPEGAGATRDHERAAGECRFRGHEFGFLCESHAGTIYRMCVPSEIQAGSARRTISSFCTRFG